jgi:hypothetical protein
MMKIISSKVVCITLSVLASSAVVADLKKLDDSSLSNINGQSGVSIDLGVHAQVGGISYFDDGNGITLKDVKIGKSTDMTQAAKQHINLDILSDGSVSGSYNTDPTRVSVGDIQLADDALHGMGGFQFDYQAVGSFTFKGGGANSSNAGFTASSNVSITNGRIAYVTQGNSFSLDGISLNLSVPNMTYDPVIGGFDFNMPSIKGDFSVAGIYLNNGTKSGGALKGNFDLSQNIKMRVGGRDGIQGMTFNVQQTFNRLNFAYGDDGYWLGLLDITGSNTLSNLTLDVAKDSTNKLGLALAFDSLNTKLSIGQIIFGASTSSIDNYLSGGTQTFTSMGQVDVNLLFANQTVDGVNYTNKAFVQGGGDLNAGSQGLRINAEWSLVSDTNQSNIVYTDDGNSMMISNISSWGKGIVTANVTTAGTINGKQYFDGLRLGFENLTGGYKIKGLRVGKNDGTLKNQPLQGGSELLLALGVYPAYDFTVNGQMTIAPGGQSGSGLTINSDIHITNGRAAITMDENGNGLWVTDLDYDMHMRNMTIDLSSQGLSIVQGESWSTMDIGNLRVGNKLSGGSFGRIVLQRYEKGSSMTIKGGGAGTVTVGGVVENRGSQGVTVSLKNIFANAVSAVKRNRFTWETNRAVSGGVSQNNTGMQIAFDNFTTNDGVDGQNTYGLQNDINVDIYQTKVVKKSNGPDSNGVVGNRGDEKIMDPSQAAGYKYVANPTATDIANRPLGFAVKANTRFKELSVGSVNLIHPTQYNAADPVNSGSTILYGLKIQNVDIVSNLTATPIQ